MPLFSTALGVTMYPFISNETYLTANHSALKLQPQRIVTSVLLTLTALFIQGHQPKIRETVSGGNKTWQIYDPTTHQKATFYSEDDVRIWLENRYRQ
ncbi:hypothetical protein IQ265_09045 [Nodosilinea sp. LEGE 06152]|uniref:hypothetical protein n=1 Tax=Nodosilinea sp. LEGE 06152 TaxID=2777966 RepID=UPI0018823595|nr:hypothetical protein [Nodosilinea sp. LEGE 06152]MBE9156972.1 hypothetical protein [Nodosilinea sp. LEGE 06152]